MLNLLKPFWLVILKWLAIVGGVFIILFKARQSGKDAERVDSLKATLKGMQKRDKIENDIVSSDNAKYERLRAKWTRN